MGDDALAAGEIQLRRAARRIATASLKSRGIPHNLEEVTCAKRS
jgi:hypothetical protein